MSDVLRRCALRLAALAGEDRGWILARLPEAARSRLGELLRELEAKPVRFDEELLAALEAPRAEPPRGLEAAGAAEAWRALEAEPDWVIAALLKGRAASWRAGLLALVAAPRAARIEEAARSLSPAAPRAAEALAAAVEERIAKERPWHR